MNTSRAKGKMPYIILPDCSEVGTITDNHFELHKDQDPPDEIIYAESNPNRLEVIPQWVKDSMIY